MRIFESQRGGGAPPPMDAASAMAASVLARDAERRMLAGNRLRGTDMVDFDVEGGEA